MAQNILIETQKPQYMCLHVYIYTYIYIHTDLITFLYTYICMCVLVCLSGKGFKQHACRENRCLKGIALALTLRVQVPDYKVRLLTIRKPFIPDILELGTLREDVASFASQMHGRTGGSQADRRSARLPATLETQGTLFSSRRRYFSYLMVYHRHCERTMGPCSTPACARARVCVHEYVYTYIHICICGYVCRRTRIHKRIYVYIHMYTHVYIHIYIYIYTYNVFVCTEISHQYQ